MSEHQLLEFVKQKHGDQKRKYTGEPYWHHLTNVRDLVVGELHDHILKAVALCHDLFEDTDCEMEELRVSLIRFGYKEHDAHQVLQGVVYLTDEYTKEMYPTLNRKKRKELEAGRLSRISPRFQTVKYADLIDNLRSIVKHDPKFAKVYIQEKEDILKVMDKGSQKLYNQCISELNEAKKSISLPLPVL